MRSRLNLTNPMPNRAPTLAPAVLALCLAGAVQAEHYTAALDVPQNRDLPWVSALTNGLAPAEAGRDFTPVVVPNGVKAEFKVVDGVKVYHLVAEPVDWEVAPGLNIRTWGYNGKVPGPLIEGAAGDRIRVYVSNRLPAPTSVHWHGMILPCGMDGVAGLTQPAIQPGETFVYEFVLPVHGTFMYHPHFDSMTQEGLGLVGMIVSHERQPREERPDRDFAIMLHEWRIDAGTFRPNPNEMTDFNVLTMNGKAMPATEPLVARLGDRVWIRYGNLSAMDHHPIHLHGYKFKVIGTDGGWMEDRSQLLPETTVIVPVGSARVVEFVADNPGDWLFHCHMTHHVMNQMGHDFPNMIGVDSSGVDEKIRALIPGYMTMGTAGMRDMTKMGMPLPENSIPMLGYTGQFGQTVLGSMANILMVREGIDSYDYPGPYEFPEGTVSRKATAEELQADGIRVDMLPDPGGMKSHDHMHHGMGKEEE